MKQLIVTADDFGLAEPVNEAVEQAHRRGILSAASLMVAAPAAADAVARARRLPDLGVGLHLVLMDGVPVLPPADIPALVGRDGLLGERPARTGAAIFFSRRVRRQVEAEIRAQFEAFRRTGLALDHVNTHHHYHLHPTVFDIILDVAAGYGAPAVRVVHEPFLRSWRTMRDDPGRRLVNGIVHLPLIHRMRRRLRRDGIATNDAIFGLNDSGRMTSRRLLDFLPALPAGVTEIYCHPATRRWDGPFAPAPEYRCVEEFEALVDPAVAAAVRACGATTIPFSRIASADVAAIALH